jgi:L,D-transpeptidase catalytic domain
VAALLVVASGAADASDATAAESGVGAVWPAPWAPMARPARADPLIHVAGIPGRLWLWATVDRPSVVRADPSPAAPGVGRVTRLTPEGTAGNVRFLATTTVRGVVWVRVAFASLPNGLTGWVPRTALGAVQLVRTELTVDRATLTATLRRSGKVIFRTSVAVGSRETPTPAGSFFVRDELAGFPDAPAYGPVAFGTSARSAVLTDWPGGGYIGLHGTDQPDLIPGYVSQGCVRFRNRDILRLAKLLPIGSSVRIL